jgi:hypothetical protein
MSTRKQTFVFTNEFVLGFQMGLLTEEWRISVGLYSSKMHGASRIIVELVLMFLN